MRRNVLLSLVFITYFSFSSASVIIEVTPLTNKILVVHFDDGYAIHHKRGQTRTNESMVVNPLDVIKAMLKNSYSISSNDDSDFINGLNPTEVGRKSKPTEFGLICQVYNNGCINSDPDHAKEHWVYLYLSTSLKSGKSYKLTLDNLAETTNIVSFMYDETALHSEAIHVNNIGYSTAAPAKYAYLYHWMGDKGSLDLTSFAGKNFKLYDTDKKQLVFTGSISFRKSKTNAETGQVTETPSANFSSADVHECDFSTFNIPGNYKIVVEGIGSSFPFVINADAYQEAFYWTMKGLYHNRSGIELKAPYTEFTRPAPHNTKITPGFKGKLKYSTFRSFDLSSSDGATADKAKIETGYKGTLENTFGWYQDAGDWDGYYTHTHVPAYLLFLYEAGKEKFTDGELNIPESGNGIPDVVDEASWLLRYFKRAKDEVKQKGWGTGGVPGARVFGDLWGADAPNDIGQGSWQDVNRDWYVLGEDPWTSYKYAALSAQLAFVLASDKKPDPEGVDWKQEAIDAYTWAKSNTKNGDDAVGDLKDIRLYAAAALYRLTGESAYHNQFVKDLNTVTGSLDQGKQDQLFGVWLYLLSWNQPREASTLTNVKTLISTSADRYLATAAESRACRWGGDFNFPMLVGQGTTPIIQAGIYGYLLNKSNPIVGDKYNKYIHTTADYFLGTNPLNTTWISGVAERSPVGLFHLDWWYRDKADANNSYPVLPGVVPYGPWRYENLGALGWWNPNWAYSDKEGNPKIYPTSVNQWPGHERWFDMRVSPLSSEFTIHQNTVIAAFVYGFLTQGATTDIQEGIVTSVETISEVLKDVTAFPNPTNDSIIIQSFDIAITSVDLLSIDGKSLKRIESSIHQNEISIDVKNFSSGVYLLKIIKDNKETRTLRIQISK